MGKGRSCRYGSERLLYPVQVSGGGHHAAGAADHLADMDEEDVWSVLAAPAPDSNRSIGSGRQPEQERRRRWTAGGLSLAFEATESAPAGRHHHHVASSAPVKVPEWPAARFPAGAGGEQHGYGVSCREEEGEWMAPHEYLQAQAPDLTTAMGQAPSLPDDAVADVLRRLAPRDIAASRRVCKSLRRVVDGRRLLRTDLLPLSLGGIFLNHFQLRSATQFLSRPTTAAAVSGRLDYTLDACHPDNHFAPAPYVLDHCNGLLLLHHCVVNPATQQWAPLPPAPDLPKPAPPIKHCWTNRHLVFDPMLSPNHFDCFIMPEIAFRVECEEFEWPPSTLILPVFSSKIGSWEKRIFCREGEAAGKIPGLVPVTRLCNERQSVYWRGSLYISCSACSILRISLSDNRYRVIRLPPPIFPKHDSRDRQQFYLGKSTKGIYCASIFELLRSHLHVWFLNDLNEWVLKHDMDIFPILPNLDYGNRCDGPWILQQFDYHEHSDEDDSVVEDNREAIVEKEKFEAIVKQGKFEWDSDNDNVLEPGGRCETTDISFLGFHPFKEVVLLSLWNRVLAYHWSSSKLQDLGKLFPDFYLDRSHIYWHTHVEESFPYTPCWLGELPGKLN